MTSQAHALSTSFLAGDTVWGGCELQEVGPGG